MQLSFECPHVMMRHSRKCWAWEPSPLFVRQVLVAFRFKLFAFAFWLVFYLGDQVVRKVACAPLVNFR